MKRILTSFLFGAIVALTTIGIVAYSRGVRLDFDKKQVTSTGILSASSYPDKASLYVNGKLVSATSTSISLSPGWYDVKITKEGYQNWEKRIRVQGEVVSLADALLVPLNPSGIRPLTLYGVINPTLSHAGDKVAYFSGPEVATLSAQTTKNQNGAIYSLDLRNGPLGSRNAPKLLYSLPNEIATSTARLIWSADDKQILYVTYKSDKNNHTPQSALLLSPDDNSLPREIGSNITTVTDAWDQELWQKDQTEMSALPLKLRDFFASTSANLRFSPDENKIMYTATASATLPPILTSPLPGSNSTDEIRAIKPGGIYTYDRKEDRNYLITYQTNIPTPDAIKWYNDSKNILMIEKDTIYIIEFDGTNKRAIYAGPFEDSILYPWGTGGKMVIMTNLNKQKALSNLYEIDLR